MSNSSTPSSLPTPPPELGVVCTPEQWNASNWSDSLQGKHGSTLEPPTIHCLTRGQSVGLALVAVAGFISLFAVLLVFILIARNWTRRKRDSSVRHSLFHGPADIYMFFLLVADLIRAVGGIMDVKWIQSGIVEVGGFCTAQGVIRQLGAMPLAAIILAISAHTFCVVWWRKGAHSRKLAVCLVAAIWIYALVLVVIGATRNIHYVTPTPYWCWIGPHWMSLRIVGEYMWLWLALVFSLIFYVLLALWNRGNIEISQKSWWRFSFRRLRSKPINKGSMSHESRLAYDLLAYPLTYAILILPLTIVRWAFFTKVPSAAALTVMTIWGLSGAANATLLLTTRPQLLLLDESPRRRQPGPAASGGTEVPLPDESLSYGSCELSPAPARQHMSGVGALPPADTPEPSPPTMSRELPPVFHYHASQDSHERGKEQDHHDLYLISPNGR